MPLTPTLNLTGPARGFWDRHADRLTRAGVLTPSDVDSFTLLAFTFGMIEQLSGTEAGADGYREMIQLTNLLKQYQALAKQFGLLPRERKQSKMTTEPPKPKNEFGL